MLTQFERIFTLDYEHTRKGGSYHIELKNGFLYITFQYSKGFKDWLYNFTFPQKAYKRMADTWRVHRGFLIVWKDIETHIKKFIDENYEGIQNIVITGYSHGGALAVLCHEWLNYNYSYDVFTYTFGTPRIIFGKIPDRVKQRLYCCFVVNNKFDIVAHLPPKNFGFSDYPHTVIMRKNAKIKPIHEHTKTAYIEGIKEHLQTQFTSEDIYYG